MRILIIKPISCAKPPLFHVRKQDAAALSLQLRNRYDLYHRRCPLFRRFRRCSLITTTIFATYPCLAFGKSVRTFYLPIRINRQMQKSVHRNDRASTAVSGTALHEVTFRLQGDETQTFFDPSYFPNWALSVSCQCLSEIVLHYFGPQVNKELTIEQAFKAILFIWDIDNRKDETSMYSAFAELLTLHERT